MRQEKEALTIREAAVFLGAHPQTVRKLARKGALPAFKLGQDWRFRRDALQRWVDTHPVRARGQKILVVDDDKAMRDSTSALLENEGYGVTTASGGAEALTRMSDELPALVLLDLQMPVMTGPATLREIRAAHGNIPVIIITGYPDSELMARALEHGPLLVLTKPVNRQHLLDGILTALRVPNTTGK